VLRVRDNVVEPDRRPESALLQCGLERVEEVAVEEVALANFAQQRRASHQQFAAR
jgi:hypothetical protein